MMQVSIVTLEGTFFYNKHPPYSDPYRVKNYQGQRYDQRPYFNSSNDRKICQAKSEKHNPYIPYESQRLKFNDRRDERNTKEDKGNVFYKK